ncbi:MAG: GGDEF domain-containing protein [Chloroflexi bacterium]|nr:GGDEF domain-containing protein [Chloroflexota bacterium]
MVEPVLTVAVLAVVANLVVMAIVLAPAVSGRRGAPLTGPGDRGGTADRRAVEMAAVAGGDPASTTAEGVPSHQYDRVVRIVSWIFLITTTTIVAVTGLWPLTQPAIFVLLGLAGLFVLVVHDVLPADALGPARFILEGSVAITFATLLVVLTGGVGSPFFFTFPLIVGGAALVVSPPVTVGLAAAAAFGYLLAVLAGPPAGELAQVTVATVGVNLTALILLAYVGMVIAREQRRSHDAAIRMSTIDPLTSLFNRTFFFAALEREIARCARSGRGFCLLMMDLDELKLINDRYGHFHGDRVLRAVGGVIRSGVRRIDTAARYGGDEFVVVLPETDPTGAFVLAEKIRLDVAALAMDIPSGDVHPSLSVGVVSYPDDGLTADELMINADEAMYRSKRAGKNRVSGVPMPEAVGANGVRADPV